MNWNRKMNCYTAISVVVYVVSVIINPELVLNTTPGIIYSFVILLPAMHNIIRITDEQYFEDVKIIRKRR